MLNDVTGLKKIYLAAGYTDLRRGIDGLATMIRFRFQLDPYDKNTLFLFCGKRTNRIKGRRVYTLEIPDIRMRTFRNGQQKRKDSCFGSSLRSERIVSQSPIRQEYKLSIRSLCCRRDRDHANRQANIYPHHAG